MNYYRIILIISLNICYFIINVNSNKDIDTFIKQHNFIFISGWPQSGTSFILNLLNLHPYISTMIDQCQHLKGIYIHIIYHI